MSATQATRPEELPPGFSPLLQKLDQLIHSRRPEEKEMWSLEDIAEYTNLKFRVVRDTLVHQPDFPTAIKPLGQKSRIWKATEVKGWLNRRRES